MRQLHLLRRPDDTLAVEVIASQVERGDEVTVVLLGGAAGTGIPEGARVIDMPPLQYDGLVELLAWSERVVSW